MELQSQESDSDSRRTFTIDEAIEAIGIGRFQYALLAYVGLAWISDALEMMILSFVGPSVKCQFHTTPAEESHITSVRGAGPTAVS
jgi:hypothetical protein